jgi:hypothetical protein
MQRTDSVDGGGRQRRAERRGTRKAQRMPQQQAPFSSKVCVGVIISFWCFACAHPHWPLHLATALAYINCRPARSADQLFSALTQTVKAYLSVRCAQEHRGYLSLTSTYCPRCNSRSTSACASRNVGTQAIDTRARKHSAAAAALSV